MKKEQMAIERILDIVKAENLSVGSALPSERKLAKDLNTSRNTIRNALRQLEARGFLYVRRGSGYYLRAKDERFSPPPLAADKWTASELGHLFEARYLFEPEIGALSARRITASLLARLEKCLVRLSRAIIAVRPQEIISEDVEFHRIVAGATGNALMVATIDRLRATNQQVLQHFPVFEDREKDALFAEYVSILKALQNHDPAAAKAVIRHNILRCCTLVMKYTQIEMPKLLREAMDEEAQTPAYSGGSSFKQATGEVRSPIFTSEEGRIPHGKNV